MSLESRVKEKCIIERVESNPASVSKELRVQEVCKCVKRVESARGMQVCRESGRVM